MCSFNCSLRKRWEVSPVHDHLINFFHMLQEPGRICLRSYLHMREIVLYIASSNMQTLAGHSLRFERFGCPFKPPNLERGSEAELRRYTHVRCHRPHVPTAICDTHTTRTCFMHEHSSQGHIHVPQFQSGFIIFAWWMHDGMQWACNTPT
jgi:hypothetical protein